MKLSKIFITFSILISPFSFLHSQLSIDMGGTMATLDTLDSYMAGPGTTYSHLKVTKGSKVRDVYVLDIDMTNRYVEIEPVQANDRLGSTETLASMYRRKDCAGHRMIGGINGCFFCTSSNITADPDHYGGLLNQPFQGSAAQGVMITEPNTWNRCWESEPNQEIGFLLVDTNNRAYVNDVFFEGMVYASADSFPILNVNRPRTFVDEDRIGLYNHFMGSTGTAKNNCTEVVFTIDHWAINERLHGTVTAINTTGGTVLQEGQAALQGFQAGRTFLNNLQVGDTFSLNLGVSIREDLSHPALKAMIGGNAFVMNHGIITKRNTSEPYNVNDYPRPLIGTNDSGNRVWMIECAKPGMPTAEACYILKAFGATAAASSDGGGSAQMNLLGNNAFATTESSPRGVGNAVWVVATAPDNQEAGQLQFVKPLASIPAYASYTPTLRAWSAEGLLLSHEYKGYTLSCEPASLGTISADGLTFTANPVTESGKLIATAGTGRVETPIEIRNGEVHIVLDSVILGNRDYKVDVQAIAGDLALPLDAKALTWESKDESRVTVNEEGILHAMANGRTQVVGSLAEFSDTLLVITEMATNSQLSFLNSPLSIDTAFSNTRTAAGVLPINVRLWGNPDSILIIVNSDAPVQAMELTYRPNNGESDATNISGKTIVNEDYTYTFAMDQLMDVADQGIYPIFLESAKFTLKDPKKSKSYHFAIKDIILCYRDWAEVTALPDILNSQFSILNSQKLMVNGQVYIIKNNHIYDVHGHEMK